MRWRHVGLPMVPGPAVARRAQTPLRAGAPPRSLRGHFPHLLGGHSVSMYPRGFYLESDGSFRPAVVIQHTRASRLLEVTQPDGGSRQVRIHPPGVAWAGLYPRFFARDTAPTGSFVFKRRALAAGDVISHAAIPTVNPHYRFQSFTSDIIDAVNHAEPLLLTGGTGVGKTSHILQLGARVHQPVLRINFNGETRLSDLIGKVTVVDGSTVWADGVLPQAMRRGWWLLLDELDFAEPAVLSLLHPVLEEQPTLTLKEHGGEVIVPHPSFRLFATANSIGAMQERSGSYAGTMTMNDAFLDRWQVLLVPNLNAADERRVLLGEVPGLKPRWARQIVEFAAQARDASGPLAARIGSDNFSTRRVLAWAKKTALHRSPIIGAHKAWLDKLPASEQEALTRLLVTHFGSGRDRSATRRRSTGGAAVKPPVGGKGKTLAGTRPRRARRATVVPSAATPAVTP